MKNNGLFTTLYIDDVRKDIKLNDNAKSRMATLTQAWKDHDGSSAASLWESFMKQAMGYLEFVSRKNSKSDSLYELFEDYGFSKCTGILYLIESDADIDDTDVGRFWPGKLIVELKKRNRNWGILSNGSIWRLYSTKSSRPFEDYVELSLSDTLKSGDEQEYGLFEQFFHADSFVPEDEETDDEKAEQEEAAGVYKCRLDRNREASESVLETKVKNPLLSQIDEVLQYICNGFIFDTPRKGDEYTEEERNDIFESAVKLLYRCLFLFYADSRRLLPSEPEKIKVYETHSIHAICVESHKLQWGTRKDNEGYDLWQHFKGLINAINEGDPEYGIMGYNGGLFDDEKEVFLGGHKLRNDFMARALYLLSYVESYNHDLDKEYKIPYEDLEVRHLGELYENILEYKVILADADRIRRRSKKGIEILLASETSKQKSDVFIRKGDVFFGESALERKQTGSYYTPESLVRFLNTKAAINPLKKRFEKEYRNRFDEFIQQAVAGQDASARQGGARAAIALIERFVREVILNFKVCDPAMGSGHFLVDLTNQMAGLVVELLNEIPDISGVKTQITSRPNTWRRLITRHCIFGVDVNPLAVDLAKLSLWLNCFASNHKLTFLDQHLRCGNSLMGIRTFEQLKSVPERKKDKKQKDDTYLKMFPDFDDFSRSLSVAAGIYKSIMDMDEDDTDRQRETFEEACALAEEKFVPIANLFTAYLMDSSITEDQYRSLFKLFAQGKDATQIGRQDLKEVWGNIEEYKNSHQFFHWVLNFPSIFGPNGSDGFDATVGNPPWDVHEPKTQEFYVNYDLNFRKYNKKQASKIINQLNKLHPNIFDKFEKYRINIQSASNYFKEPSAYKSLREGKIDLYKAFLERFFILLKKGGRLGVVVPSGMYNAQGCISIRKMFLSQSQIDFIYCFENRWPTVFKAVDGRFKFIAFSTKKGSQTKQFKCVFMEHDPIRLPAIDMNPITMNVEQLIKFAPDTLTPLEVNSNNSIEILTKCYDEGITIKDQNGIEIYQELNATSSFSILNERSIGYPLWEGKNIWQFDSFFSSPKYWVHEEKANEFLRKKYQNHKTRGPNFYRLCFRGVAASTNERTLISAIVPPNHFCEVKCTCIDINLIKNGLSLLLNFAGVLNSFVYDYCIRFRVSSNVNIFHIEQLPLLTNLLKPDEFLIPRVARLISINEVFSKLWRAVYSNPWQSPTHWYPEMPSIDNYGPAHEQEIRCRIRDEAKKLTSEWRPNCGVHDRLPDRRDTGDRAQLRAEIDAYVAHLYGLSRDDFSYILDTFPVLKRKEEAAFGEFMSKRKCLEEYDRIATIL